MTESYRQLPIHHLELTRQPRRTYASIEGNSMAEDTSQRRETTPPPWDPLDELSSPEGGAASATVEKPKNGKKISSKDFAPYEGPAGEVLAEQGGMRRSEDTSGLAELKEAFRQPKNLDELAYAINENFKDFSSNFPLIERVRITTENGETKEVNRVNDANFLRWVRHRMLFLEGEEGPDEKVNYFSEILIPFGQSNVNLNYILKQEERFMRDGTTGKVHKELAEQIRREVFARTTIRGRDIDYRRSGSGMGNDEGIAGTVAAIMKNSTMTRSELWSGKSLWYWAMEAPADFVNESDFTEEEKHDPLWKTRNQDTRLGRATATSLMAYYHLCDIEKLKEMLNSKDGKEAAFFRKESWDDMRMELAKENLSANPQYAGDKNDSEDEKRDKLRRLADQYIDTKTLNGIFDDSGKLKDPTKFVEFINFFAQAQPNSNQRQLVRKMLQQSIGEKYRLWHYAEEKNEKGEVVLDPLTGKPRRTNEKVMDTEMMSYAESQAFLMTRWTGVAARNDWAAAAYDAQSKILHTREYRLKQASPTRGGAFGNMYNVGQFKALGVNYLDAITTLAKGPDGQPLLLREVFENIARAPVVDEKDEENEEKVLEERMKSMEALSGLVFASETEQNYANNGTNRWYSEYHSFIGAKELHLQKTVEWAALNGVIYDPAQFGEVIQEGFLKPLRYGYSTWQLQFGKSVRDLVDFDPKNELMKNKPIIKVAGTDKVFMDASMADMMYGDQVLDVEDFWMGVPKLDENNQIMKDEKGNTVYEKKIDHIVDSQLVQGNRGQLFKQMALARIAADIYSHVDLKSPYVKWDAATVEAVIKALERIPGKLLFDENDLKNTTTPEFFFDKGDIDYLRHIAHVSKKNMITKFGTKELVKETAGTFKNFMKAFFKGIK